MDKYEYIEKLLNIAYKNTLCIDNDFKIKHAKGLTLFYIKRKNKNLYNKNTIDYINNYKFN